MRECKKCGKRLFNRYKDRNGKEHNCQRRKYCFECSPFGSRNTKKLEKINYDDNGLRICKKCNKSFISKRRLICNTCNTNRQRQGKKSFLMNIVGYSCWNCGYGGEEKYTSILEMHHVDPVLKKFALNINTISRYSPAEIVEEAKKCVLLCANCHREYHNTDIVSDEQIKTLHKKWEKLEISEYVLKESS